jgi:hypothetical protein
MENTQNTQKPESKFRMVQIDDATYNELKRRKEQTGVPFNRQIANAFGVKPKKSAALKAVV